MVTIKLNKYFLPSLRFLALCQAVNYVVCYLVAVIAQSYQVINIVIGSILINVVHVVA